MKRGVPISGNAKGPGGRSWQDQRLAVGGGRKIL